MSTEIYYFSGQVIRYMWQKNYKNEFQKQILFRL